MLAVNATYNHWLVKNNDHCTVGQNSGWVVGQYDELRKKGFNQEIRFWQEATIEQNTALLIVKNLFSTQRMVTKKIRYTKLIYRTVDIKPIAQVYLLR